MKTPRISFVVLIALVSIVAAPALACINDYAPNQKAVARSMSFAEELFKVELIEPWTTRRDRLRKEVEAGGDYKVRNDLASALMHTGDPKAAIQILEGIEKTNPGLYRTASNLGTAYELAGENGKALEWIRKGIQANASSHVGSEWIHVKILEAKLSASKDPDQGIEGSVLGLAFGNQSKPEQPTSLPKGNSGETITLEQIDAGLKYQLHERLQFVKAPDPFVASLLFDLGNIIALKSANLGMGQGLFGLAQAYANSENSSNDALRNAIQFRLKYAKLANMQRSFYANPFELALVLVVAALALYVVFKVWRRRRLLAALKGR
jgi:tetratricopeptide (TPR) repeat protein